MCCPTGVWKMFRRKLRALGHPSADTLNAEDPDDLKVLVIWLEDQKIRHYKVEDRANLHNHEGTVWIQTFVRYLEDLECPYNFDSGCRSVLDWLLGIAVRYEYEDTSRGDGDMGCGLLPEEPTRIDAGLAKSALDIEPSDKTFTAGVKALAKILQVTQHPDPCVLLEAVRIVIQTYLSSSALEAANPDACDKLGAVKSSVKSLQFSVTAKECGFDLGDPVLSEAAKVLRLLHIRELRDLQTHINQVIVAVQALTADPKTDQSLGRVGK